jgi:hypothetical protein
LIAVSSSVNSTAGSVGYSSYVDYSDTASAMIVGNDYDSQSGYENEYSILGRVFAPYCDTYVLFKNNAVKPVFPSYCVNYKSPLIIKPKYHRRCMICKSGFLARKGKMRKRGRG